MKNYTSSIEIVRFVCRQPFPLQLGVVLVFLFFIRYNGKWANLRLGPYSLSHFLKKYINLSLVMHNPEKSFWLLDLHPFKNTNGTENDRLVGGRRFPLQLVFVFLFKAFWFTSELVDCEICFRGWSFVTYHRREANTQNGTFSFSSLISHVSGVKDGD